MEISGGKNPQFSFTKLGLNQYYYSCSYPLPKLD